jgi:hypothetical protein
LAAVHRTHIPGMPCAPQPVAVKKFFKAEDGLHECQMLLVVGRPPSATCIELKALCEERDSLQLVVEYFPRCGLASLSETAP